MAKTNLVWTSLLTSLFLGWSAYAAENVTAQENVSPNAKAHVCESGEDRRLVEIRSTAGGGCKVIYTRDGEAKEVGSAAHSPQVCDRVLENIIKNLEASRFQCS